MSNNSNAQAAQAPAPIGEIIYDTLKFVTPIADTLSFASPVADTLKFVTPITDTLEFGS